MSETCQTFMTDQTLASTVLVLECSDKVGLSHIVVYLILSVYAWFGMLLVCVRYKGFLEKKVNGTLALLNCIRVSLIIVGPPHRYQEI
jgi:hypothetical protein